MARRTWSCSGLSACSARTRSPWARAISLTLSPGSRRATDPCSCAMSATVRIHSLATSPTLAVLRHPACRGAASFNESSAKYAVGQARTFRTTESRAWPRCATSSWCCSRSSVFPPRKCARWRAVSRAAWPRARASSSAAPHHSPWKGRVEHLGELAALDAMLRSIAA